MILSRKLGVLTFQEKDEVLLVVRSLRVFPIKVKAVEVPVSQEGDSAVDEGLTGVSGHRHVLELLCSKRPSTWQKNLCTFILEIISGKISNKLKSGTKNLKNICKPSTKFIETASKNLEF